MSFEARNPTDRFVDGRDGVEVQRVDRTMGEVRNGPGHLQRVQVGSCDGA